MTGSSSTRFDYSTAYFEKDLNDIDLDFVELTLGPSFNMKR